ncbi:hypothetical protein [Comamonas thiooxydans]|uniref:hypothetical protein n=1 Tax=Comamonas thiooxydans TaxID=363952 RepID=UPI000B412459|nr:hypothetical protein [Comamonas thiooxydans]
MVSLRRFVQDPLQALKEEKFAALLEREQDQQQQRAKLRDFATQLREVVPNVTAGPANASWPSVKLSPAENFRGVLEPGQYGKNESQLPPAAQKEFDSLLKEASQYPDAKRRDATVAKAAKVAATALDTKYGITEKDPGLLAIARQEAREQVVFASREIGEKLGLSKTESTVIGYALERALEREGVKVLASHAIDKVADKFQASAAAVSTAVTHAAKADNALAKSVAWLGEHGVTRDKLKDLVKNHTGKVMIGLEVFNNPEVARRATQIMAHSSTAIEGFSSMVKDKELRGAVGTMMVGVGDALTSSQVGRSAGSAAILAGSALRGDSLEDTGRHVFRTVMSVAGGAAGAVAGAGFASVVTGVAGAAAGSALADKILDYYDSKMGNSPQEKVAHVSKEQLAESAHVLGDKAKAAGSEAVKDFAQKQSDPSSSTSEKVAQIGREYSMSANR